jgi:hypothetical protein
MPEQVEEAMQLHTRAIVCPVCGGPAMLAFATRDQTSTAPDVDPNDIGLTCESGCRPTMHQVEPLLDIDEP